MDTTIAAEIAALRVMSPAQLRQRYFEVFGEASRSGHKDWLFKRVAYRIQVLAEGGLSERARRRAEELAADADIRVRPPREAPVSCSQPQPPRPEPPIVRDERLPPPGGSISRVYRGKRILVTVLAGKDGLGFEYAGERYRSLTAVAKAVTGTHWNGFLFLGIKDRGGGRGRGRERAAKSMGGEP